MESYTEFDRGLEPGEGGGEGRDIPKNRYRPGSSVNGVDSGRIESVSTWSMN